MKVEIAASPVLLTVTAQSQMILDRQTGLYYQQVVVQNCGLGTIFGLRMTATNLPSIAVTNLVYMVSATGTNNNGAPYVEYSGSLSPGSTNTFTVSYYSKIRQAPTGVGLLVEPFNVVPPAVSTGTLLAIGSPFVRSDGKLAFQFSTLRGRTYVVDYSSDLVTWKQAQSTVIGNGGTVIWVDAGPPDTESAVVLGSRYYRVLLLPQ